MVRKRFRIGSKTVIFHVAFFTICCLIVFLAVEIGLRAAGNIWGCIYNASRSDHGTFYFYVVGGSTSYGEPFGHVEHKISFPRIMSYMLNGKVHSKKIEIVNLAQAGATIEYEYWLLFKELFVRPPGEGVLLIYSGINERVHDLDDGPFFKCWKIMGKSILLSKTLLLLDGFSSGFVSRLPGFGDSLPKYEYRLGKMITLAKKHGMKVLVSTLVGNISDYPPSEREFESFKNAGLFNSGKKYESTGNFKKAMDIYEGILEQSSYIPPHLYYHLASCYRNLGFYERAREYYLEAIDNGAANRPIRAQNDVIRKSARKYNIGLVDSAERFENNSPNGLVGYNLFMDPHHPNLKGYILLAKGFISGLEKIMSIKVLVSNPSQEDVIKYFHFDTEDYFSAYVSLTGWFCGEASHFNPRREMLKMAEFYLKKAELIHPNRPEVFWGHLMISVLKKKKEEAVYWLNKGEFLEQNKAMLRKTSWMKNLFEELHLPDVLWNKIKLVWDTK